MTDAPRPIMRTRATLATLRLLLERDAHGYAIAQATGRVPYAAYTTLKRLARDGLVDTYTDPGHPRRQMYRLTPHGRAQAERLLNDTPERT